MKKIILALLLLLNILISDAQSSFDKKLDVIGKDISDKLNKKNKKKLVVLFVTDVNKVQTSAGKYIGDYLSNFIVNDTGAFELFDRDNLTGIAEVKKLIDEGYIDALKAKEIGKLLSVEAIVIGNYTVLDTTLKLTIKALDVNSGFVIASTMKDLPLDAVAGVLLGINIANSLPSTGNRGFNTPLKSGENYNSPETVTNECDSANTGDYCFTNSTTGRLKVLIYIESEGMSGTMIEDGDGYGYFSVTWSGGEVTLEPGQTECFYNIKSGAIVYDVREIKAVNTLNPKTLRKGNIKVEKCKSKTFVIN